MSLNLQEIQWDEELTPVVVPRTRHRSKKVKKIRIKYGTLACAIVVLCVFVNLVQLQLSIIKLDRQIEARNQEKQQLLGYQEKLQQDVKLLQSGEYIEKLAREQLGMVKPGENPVTTRGN